jgi:dynein heavy chain
MIITISKSLDNLAKLFIIIIIRAIDGLVSMSNDLDDVLKNMFDNRVPESWAKVAYPSLKPLGSWVIDFLKRLEFMQLWID